MADAGHGRISARLALEMDLSLGFSFQPLPALARGDIDLVITSDPQALADIDYEPLFGYQALLAMAPKHPLARREWIAPADLRAETLITYPVERTRLDIFTRFLDPAGVEPAAVRTAELTVMMMQLVASRRGIAALPNWALMEYVERDYVIARPLGARGQWGTLHAATRAGDRDLPYMRGFSAHRPPSLVPNPERHPRGGLDRTAPCLKRHQLFMSTFSNFEFDRQAKANTRILALKRCGASYLSNRFY